MRKRALSQHVALVSVKRDRAKEGLRINEGLGAVSSLLRAEMFERQICQDGCGVSASQDQAFSSFQRQVKMSRRGAAGARHKTCLACFERRCSSARSVKMGAVRRPAGIKRFRVSRGKSRCRDGVPRAHVTRCLTCFERQQPMFIGTQFMYPLLPVSTGSSRYCATLVRAVC